MRRTASSLVTCARYSLASAASWPEAVSLLESEGCVVTPGETAVLDDLYLDTFDWLLFQSRLSLCFRTGAGRPAFALRGLPEAEGGAAAPIDREVRAPSGAESDPSAAVPRALMRLCGDIISPRRLVPQLRVRTSVIPCGISFPDGMKVRAAAESSTFHAEGFNPARRGARRMFRLSAAPAGGRAAGLAELDSILAPRFEHAPAGESMLEAAIAGLGIAFPAKNPPPELRPRPDDRLDAALGRILAFQFRRIEENVPGLLRDIDTEFVHQARVCARRMRSAMRFFEGALPSRAAASLGDGLRWLAGLLGAVRDLDVFLLGLPGCASAAGIAAGEGPLEAIEGRIRDRRAALQAALCAGLGSARFLRLKARIGSFAARPAGRRALPMLRETAPRMIMDRFDSAVAQGRKVVAKPKLANFHKLRIRFKKLRYACEFVSPAYGGSPDPFVRETVRIQDCLGDLQDTVFARKLIEETKNGLRAQSADSDLLFTLGRIFEVQARIAGEKQASFAAIWEAFDRPETRNILASALRLGGA